MPNITRKNISEEIYAALKKAADKHHRSINKEVIHIIENAALNTAPDSEMMIEKIRITRKKTESVMLTNEIIQQAKETGRP